MRKKTLIEPIGDHKDSLPLLYDGELMLGGGHLRGWAVEDPALIDQINAALADLADEKKFAARWPRAAGEPPMVLAVGDGNHSLATAKAYWEELKKGLTPRTAARPPPPAGAWPRSAMYIARPSRSSRSIVWCSV